jgi:exosortase D (VPLPA-CTERM-specific)
MPYFIDAQLSWWLQLQSSSIGVAVLRFLGVPVYLQGNVIDLGNYALQVVEACSGLRYLYPLSSIGFLLAYLFQAPLWQRAIVFLAVMPITVLMNSLRIAVIGALVNTWGNSAAEGFLHFFEGWVIFMTCAAMLLATMWLLDRLGAKRTLPELLAFPPVPAVMPRSVERRLNPVLFISAALLACGVGLHLVEGRQELKPERVSFRYFPLQIDEWVGRESFLGHEVENALGASDYLLVDYYSNASSAVNLYISYYESQRKGVSPHSPRVCMPGGGWVITDFQSITLASPAGTTFPVNRAEIALNDQRQLVYYWFEQRGRQISNEYAMKWFLFRDSLIMNRTDGALVRVSTMIDPSEPEGAADQRLRGFLSSISALLPEYVPAD